MKKIFFLSIFAVILFQARLNAEIIDKIVASVNDEVITEGEVSRLLNPLYMQYKTIYSPDEFDIKIREVRAKLIRDLIDDKLLLSQAKKEGITASAEEIDKKVEEIRKTFPSREDFDNAILYQNLTIADLKERFKNENIKSKLIDKHIRYMIDITPVEVRNYYKSHQGEFNEPESVNLRLIFIKKNGESSRVAAEDALRLLRTGADFSEIAKKYSNAANAEAGGDMGVVFKGKYKESIDKVIFSLKENTPSDVVATDAGYYIFKVEKKNPPHLSDFDQVKEFVKNKLYMEKADQKLKEYLDSLKKNAYISIK